jgi:SPP1 family phage portal protein
MLFKNITEINAATIKTLITKANTEHTKIRNLYERYKQTTQGVPILTRIYKLDGVAQTDKINNKVANDFVGEIVDMKVGFFCGVPISYTIDKAKYQQEKSIVSKVIDKVKSVFTKQEPKTETVIMSKYDKDMQALNDFNKMNSIADLDVETAKRGTICGYCGRLIYTDTSGDKPVEKVKLIEPWECIFIGESIEEPDFTIRYFDTITYNAKGDEVKISKAEVYSASKIQYYMKNDKEDYIIDTAMQQPVITHMFGSCPLFGFANNDEMLGDCNKVLTLIDAYDKLTSDMSSESESWRMAYMVFKNCSIDAKTITAAKQTGAFSLNGDDTDAKFLVKDLPVEFQKYFLTLLENNIYRFSATPNMNDQNFSGNITGIAIKNKFRPFEDKCKRSELKFKKSFQNQFDILCKVWADKGVVIDPLSIDEIFTRNYPQNYVEEVQMCRDGKGIISQKTLFGLVSFITDPEKEIEQLKDEETENLDSFIMRNEALKQTGDNSDEDEKEVDKNIPEDKTKQSISKEVKE